MYFLPLFLCTTVILLCDGKNSISTSGRQFHNIAEAETLFEEFIKTYKKKYDENEYKTRLQHFINNLKLINERNEHDYAEHGINEFSDMSWEEFSSKYTMNLTQVDLGDISTLDDDFEGIEAPARFDYRDFPNKVNPPKFQGNCGSCWAFSAVAALETTYAMKYGTLYDLSEQQVVDCTGYPMGCNGGAAHLAFKSLRENGGIMTQRDYPYFDGMGPCRFDRRRAVVTPIASTLVRMDEERMKMALVSYGPLSIAICVFERLNTYRGSVLLPSAQECSANCLPSHAVTIVGYGTDEHGTDYWTIKNSYGTSWGDQGYFRILRGRAVCNISKYVAFVQV